MTLWPFIALTFAISLVAFACIAALPAARSPESAAGLPFWLLMVWGPSLAAIILAAREGALAGLLQRVVRVDTVPPEAWAMVAGPLLLLMILRPMAPDDPQSLGVGLAVAMIGFNLILGPLGEELGWRGVLQEHLNHQMGWLSASLIVGLVWLTWHLPLWTIESPHAQIALPLFAAHCMVYAILTGAAYTISCGSILPAILIHLTVNLAANYAVFAGFQTPNAWFSASLGPYLVLALCAVALVYARTGEIGLRLSPV